MAWLTDPAEVAAWSGEVSCDVRLDISTNCFVLPPYKVKNCN